MESVSPDVVYKHACGPTWRVSALIQSNHIRRSAIFAAIYSHP